MSITKFGWKDFGAPLIKIWLFNPLYSLYKKMKNDMLEDLNGQILLIIGAILNYKKSKACSYSKLCVRCCK